MPQLTNIILKDGKATPANHTFSPNGIQVGGLATLVERSASGVPFGQPTLTLSSTTTSQGRIKVKAVLANPQVQVATVEGISKASIARVAYATLEFSYDGTSEKQERTDMRALMKSLCDDASFVDMTDNLTTLY